MLSSQLWLNFNFISFGLSGCFWNLQCGASVVTAEAMKSTGQSLAGYATDAFWKFQNSSDPFCFAFIISNASFRASSTSHLLDCDMVDSISSWFSWIWPNVSSWEQYSVPYPILGLLKLGTLTNPCPTDITLLAISSRTSTGGIFFTRPLNLPL